MGAGKHFILHDLEPMTLFLPDNRCQRGNGKFNHRDSFSLFKLVMDLILLDSFVEQEIDFERHAESQKEKRKIQLRTKTNFHLV